MRTPFDTSVYDPVFEENRFFDEPFFDVGAGPGTHFSELLTRHNRPVPRYTSYPPANHFTEGFDAGHLRREWHASQRPISLYCHIPFSRQRCFFCGCNATMRREYLDTGRYVDALLEELRREALVLQPGRRVIDIHWGGGTPTFLSAEDLERLALGIRRYFNVADDAGFSIEIDPRQITPAQIETLARVGVRRASIGVQDTTPAVQEAINRVQPMSLNRTIIHQLRLAGIQSINIDLIYGLPHQTLESFQQTLDAVCSLDPERIAVFGYAHLPEKIPVQRVLEKRGGLPGPELRLGLLQLAVETLTRRGYTYLGLDHFAKPGDALARAYAEGRLHRNFNGYTDRGASDLIAVGPSAISESNTGYAQNLKDPAEWLACVQSGQSPKVRGIRLTLEQEIRRAAIQQVLSQPHFMLSAFIDSFGTIAEPLLRPALHSLEDLEQDGLLRRWPGGFTILPAGRLFNRVIAHRFDEGWRPAHNRPTAHAPAI